MEKRGTLGEICPDGMARRGWDWGFDAVMMAVEGGYEGKSDVRAQEQGPRGTKPSSNGWLATTVLKI